MYESTSGAGSAVFTVLLNNPSPSSKVTVNYAVTAGTAVAGTDFKLQHGGTGTLSFPLGTVTQHVVVPVYFHDIATSPLTFYVTLSSPSAGYELNRAVGTGTLLVPVYVGGASITAQNVPEGDSGPYHNIRIPIVFTRPTTAAGSLTLTIQPASVWGSTRRNGGDYGTPATKYIYFNAGTVEHIVNIPIYPDTRPEGDETFHISIGTATASPDQLNAYVTILGDE